MISVPSTGEVLFFAASCVVVGVILCLVLQWAGG